MPCNIPLLYLFEIKQKKLSLSADMIVLHRYAKAIHARNVCETLYVINDLRADSTNQTLSRL